MFRLHSAFQPAGDQPRAIEKLAAGIRAGAPHQCLLGITGSGKTFTMAAVIEACRRPTLVLSPNKTLAAQLYSEFKELFPSNAVEYFVRHPIISQGLFTVRGILRSTFHEATTLPILWHI